MLSTSNSAMQPTCATLISPLHGTCHKACNLHYLQFATSNTLRTSCTSLQVWVGWQMMSAITHRRVDILVSQHLHMLHMLQHLVNMMSMEVCSHHHQASKQAARHEGMQLASVVYRPWLPPPDCLLTWQQMTTALSWRQIVQIMVCLMPSVSALHVCFDAAHLPHHTYPVPSHLCRDFADFIPICRNA